MQYRPLGRTGLQVSAIGLGTEHLLRACRETVVEVVHTALDHGVNYLDLIWAHPHYRDNLAAALQDRRDELVLAGHLGSTLQGEQYKRSRKADVAERFLLDLLERLQTDYVDVLMLHNVNTDREYDMLLQPNGVVELARRWQQQGKARCVALSGHSVELMNRALDDGLVDAIMLPVNMAGNAQPGRRELLQRCAREQIGLVAMKAYAGGKLLQQRQTVRFPHYQTGGEAFKKKVPEAILPLQCLHYVLCQSGVSCVIPGVKDRSELLDALALLQASEEERDFSDVLCEFAEYVSGECVYCNHCLPCPVKLDIAQILRLVDTAAEGVSPELQRSYNVLAVKASACTRCGACVKRCPFGVDVLAKIDRAIALFETG
ncbi:MAG: aldo/keto reductase [Chloroflexia bacterium]|nr:aldo/keto reductase [Chloroflexia bacterium]